MANFCVCNVAFDWSGRRFHVGDVIEDDNSAYVLFPGRFDRQQEYVTGSAGTVLTGGTLGATVVGKLPITNSAGTVLGYVPIYNAITGT